MSVDAVSGDGSFTQGLLRPNLPVPHVVHGQSAKRYAVYRNNVTVSLVKAMEANFPVVRRLLGEVYFGGLAREFVQTHPPQSPVLHGYGEAFPQFLKSYDDLTQYPYLADVAVLERLYLESYHEADAEILKAEDLLHCAPEALMSAKFMAHPTLRIMRSDFAIGSIYLANRSGQTHEFDPAASEWVLLTRPQHSVDVRVIDQTTAIFIYTLKTNQTLAQAADAAFAVSEEFDFTAALSLVIQVGAFSQLQSTENN